VQCEVLAADYDPSSSIGFEVFFGFIDCSVETRVARAAHLPRRMREEAKRRGRLVSL
jgi:hypothetical protein